MTTTATVNSSPITATVAGGAVSATVTSSSVSAIASGGVGPAGPQGVVGPPGNSLSAASDVQLSNISEGDLLRYGSGGKWQNYPESNLVIDGTNF